jgi:hypothetical protein
VTIGGSLYGGQGLNSGTVFSPGKATSVSVTGSLVGSSGEHSGAIYTQQLGKATVYGSLFGGAGLLSGGVFAEDSVEGGNRTSSVTIYGGITAYNNDGGGILINGKTGTVKIYGNVTGVGLGTRALLRFSGIDATPGPRNASDALAVTSVTILGSVKNTDIFAGYDGDEEPFRGDAGIGALSIYGSAESLRVAAGVNRGADGLLGTFDDSLFSPRGTGLLPTIGSVTIRGAFTSGGTDGSIITAAIIKSLKVGTPALSYTLDSRGVDDFTVGVANDIVIREIPNVV